MNRERDAELSALLDGALAAAEASALREQLARDPALAARLEELARVDAALRALPARPAPADLRARLQQKIDAEAAAAAQPTRERALGSAAPRRPRAFVPRHRNWALTAAAAAVAAVSFVLAPIFREQEAATRVAQTQPAPAPSEPPVHRTETALAAAEATTATPKISPAGETPHAQRVELAATETPAPEAPSGSPAGAVAETLAALEAAAEEPAAGLDPGASDAAVVAIDPRATSPEPLLSDAEAAALEGLELEDASVVAVLDLLGALGDLEEGAS